MKVILNIEDDILHDMQLWSDVRELDLSVMLSNLFVTYLRDPSIAMNKEYDADSEDVEKFYESLCEHVVKFSRYLSDEAEFSKDKSRNNRMVDVIEYFMKEYLTRDSLKIDLYKVYKATQL